ncbi:hypothetical protein [Vibrio harveyi]|uniref:hypothetical protein n=1 Tax=Vibrio harveyi TaxID=669 RepID=UPI002380813F|nr:hypothetical protein [Vibrio harveyi]
MFKFKRNTPKKPSRLRVFLDNLEKAIECQLEYWHVCLVIRREKAIMKFADLPKIRDIDLNNANGREVYNKRFFTIFSIMLAVFLSLTYYLHYTTFGAGSIVDFDWRFTDVPKGLGALTLVSWIVLVFYYQREKLIKSNRKS